MTRIFVTGANGHVGANTVRELLNKGYEVVPFVRKSSDTRGLDGLGLTYQYGDVMDKESLIAGAEGCDVILHIAAVYSLWEKNVEDIIQPALVGTKNIFEAAAHIGVSRLVYTSSVAAVGFDEDPDITRTEKDWNEDPHNVYIQAKTDSEREAWRLSELHGIPTISLLPSTVLGPYDYGITPSSQLVQDMLNGRGFTWKGGLNIVDVGMVAQAHAAAVELGEPGQRYIIAGHNIHMREFGSILKELTGINVIHLGANKQMSILTGKVFDAIAKVTKKQPLFSENIARDSIERYANLDNSLGIETFGITPRDKTEIFTDCIRWLLHINAFKPKIAAQLADKFTPLPEWQMT